MREQEGIERLDGKDRLFEILMRLAWAIGEALAFNTSLTRLNLCENVLGEGAGEAIGQALAVNTTLTAPPPRIFFFLDSAIEYVT